MQILTTVLHIVGHKLENEAGAGKGEGGRRGGGGSRRARRWCAEKRSCDVGVRFGKTKKRQLGHMPMHTGKCGLYPDADDVPRGDSVEARLFQNSRIPTRDKTARTELRLGRGAYMVCCVSSPSHRVQVARHRAAKGTTAVKEDQTLARTGVELAELF